MSTRAERWVRNVRERTHAYLERLSYRRRLVTAADEAVGQPALVGEVLAKQIISIASNGERDPQALARRALKELGVAGSET